MLTMALEQIRVGYDNFCYLISCPKQKKAAIIDPGFDATEVLQRLNGQQLSLEYIILTHYHSDHTADCKRIKKLFPSSKIVASEFDGKHAGVQPDIVVTDGRHIALGDLTFEFLITPGHTPGGICIIVDNAAILTGDTLFIGDCGRTDLPGGDLEQMFQTLHEKIMKLPDHLVVYPGHDYGDTPFDTLGNQKRINKTLRAQTLREFSLIP